jgi:superfamily II helicase
MTVNALIKTKDLLYSRLMRMKAADFWGNVKCYLCKDEMRWEDAEVMHFISRKHHSTRFLETNTHVGCKNCNQFKKQHLQEYEAALVKQYGSDIIRELRELSAVPHIYDRKQLEKEIKELKEEIKNGTFCFGDSGGTQEGGTDLDVQQGVPGS